MCGVVWGCRLFKPYLLGRKFTIITYHKALCHLASMKDPTSRTVRWNLKLSEFDYTIVHKAGKLHTNVDALSRNIPITNVNVVKTP